MRLCPPNCTDRYPGCHGKCKTYKDNKADWEARKAYLKKDSQIERYAWQKSRQLSIALTERNRRKNLR